MEEELNDKNPAGEPALGPTRITPVARRKGLRALYDRLRGGPTSGPVAADLARTPRPREETGNRIGRYTITGKLGEGGMGVVFAARDEVLGRSVALKKLSALADDETARKRFWREARAAASVNHPNVCQVYEIGEDAGELYIAMELLEGEPLSERLRRGALRVDEAVPIGLEMLAALSALHALGLVHRDLKPSNVFLTPHGVKLLDFGLARPVDREGMEALGDDAALTRTGLVVGTPRYIAPEQISGQPFDARSDLFAVGAILFEMLAGRPAFEGRTVVELLHATLHDQPPALTGSPAIAATDRVIRRALAKRPSDRPQTAEAMAAELRAVRGSGSDSTPVLARALTRLVVLPFRVLRADPETDFLAFSLADALATSLSGIDSLVLRSSATAARFARESPDLKAVAAEADVDLVVLGTLLRSGDEVRATVQLVEAQSGTLLASHSVQAPLGDLFRLQDDVARRVVEALALPLSGREVRRAVDAPKSARAYEFYLRANDLARSYDQLPMARNLYLQCVEQDPDFAPAWAHLGRCHLVIGKYLEDASRNYERAEEAFHRALELSPELPVAHRFYAHLQAELGQSQPAMVRLLGQGAHRGNDPDLFAGLVHVCRYSGLFEQSLAAHAEARRLDPNIPTSVDQTLLMACDFDRLVQIGKRESPLQALAFGLAGRRDEARAALDAVRGTSETRAFRLWVDWLGAWIALQRDEMLARVAEMNQMTDIRIVQDPESLFMEGWMLCEAGENELGLDRLGRAVTGGYLAAETLTSSPHFDSVREDPAFQALLLEAQTRRSEALTAFRAAGGQRLLGR